MYAFFTWALAAYEQAVAMAPQIAKFLQEYSNQVTFGVAAALVVLKILLRLMFRAKPCATAGLCIEDFLNGCLLVPFGSIGLSVFSQEFLKRTEDGILMISIAGAIGLFFVLDKISKFT